MGLVAVANREGGYGDEQREALESLAPSMVEAFERKRSEGALQANEERLRALVTASSEVLYRVNPDWSEMCELDSRGAPADTERPSRTWLQEYIHPADQAEVMAAVEEAMRTKSVFDMEHRVLQADGSIGWVHSRAAPLLNAEGEIIEWYGSAGDITERRRIEAGLRESELRFSSLFESMREGMVLHELVYDDGEAVDYRVLDVNPAFQRQTGLERDHVRGQLASQFYGTGVAPYLAEYVAVVESGKPISFETYFPPLQRHFQVSAVAPLPGHFATIFEDITERKRIEETLRLSEAKYRTLFDSIDEGFLLIDVIFDEDGRPEDLQYVEANAAATAMLGRDFTGLRLSEVDSGYESYWYEIFGEVATSGRSVRAEHYAAPDKRWYEFYAFRIGGHDSRRVASIFKDTTDRKRAEEALRESEMRFRCMADGSPFPIWVTDTECRLQFVNSTYCRFFGVSEEEVLGPNWMPLVHPEDKARYVAEFAAATAERRPFKCEARVRTADGTWRWIASVGSPRFSATGAFLGMVGSSPEAPNTGSPERS